MVHVIAHALLLSHKLTYYTGNKEIHPVNFIRMRVAVAQKPSVMAVSRYTNNWKFLSTAELKLMYLRVVGFLEHSPHGEYFAIQHIFGSQVAIRLADLGEVISPGTIPVGR